MITMPDIWNVITFPQGFQNGQRIGLKLENCRLTAKIFVTAMPYSSTVNASMYPKDLYMLVIKQKEATATVPDAVKH